MQRLARLPTAPHLDPLLRGKPVPFSLCHKHHLLKSNSYQMVLHRPVETATVFGNFGCPVVRTAPLPRGLLLLCLASFVEHHCNLLLQQGTPVLLCCRLHLCHAKHYHVVGRLRRGPVPNGNSRITECEVGIEAVRYERHRLLRRAEGRLRVLLKVCCTYSSAAALGSVKSP
jgi:hypothetical protein